MKTDRLLRRYRPELLWVAFVAANYAGMVVWPNSYAIPCHLVWISLTLLYAFRVWPLRPALIVVAGVIATMVAAIGVDALRGVPHWDELFEIPAMVAMFLLIVWYARRHRDMLALAEQRAEERRSLLERQERFIHDASHELRTPVTIARGHLELLRGRNGGPPEVDVALDELTRIDAIIERLLLLATVDQPDFVFRTEVELEPLLEDIFMRWSEVAPRAWRLGPLASGRLVADADRLRAAVDALLENALKYTERSAAIELRARRDGPGHVLIEVEDEGCGVPEEALQRIFDRFARADPARTRSAGGVGLGLAIVDAITKGHGGTGTVTSTPQGTIFALRLPNFSPAPAELQTAPLVPWATGPSPR